MKKIRIITAAVAAILLIGVGAACYAAGYYMFQHTMQLTDPGKTETGTAAFLYSVGFNRRGFERTHDITPIEIASTTGDHIIPADLIAGNGRGTVILVHGPGVHRAAAYPVAEMFLSIGYDVLAYDQRSAGENTAPYTTYGYLESRDLADCVRWAREQGTGEIVLWGVSYGAATVGIALSDRYVQETVKAAILDSPISDMRSMLLEQMEENHTPIPTDFLMTMGNLVTRLRLGFWYSDADVRAAAAQTSIPVLLLTSRADQVAPFYMGDEIYNAIPHENKRIHTVVDSVHGEIFFDHQADYVAVVEEFLSTHY